jgi:hypothetical protein
MKAFLRTLIFVALPFLISSRLHAQCEVSNIIIQNISVAASPAPGTCTVTFDASFTIENNNGNKYIFIHAWTEQDYPNYFQCVNGQTTLNGSIAAPEAADLGNEFMTIAINNDVVPPVLLSTYTPDPSVPITPVNSVERVLIGGDSATFILRGVTVTLPIACGTPTVLIADLWSSQSAQAQRAHCVNCGIQYGAGFLRVQGIVNCAQLQYNATITKNVSQDVSGFYRIYADINGDGYFTPAIDTMLADATNFTISGAAGTSLSISGPVPAANVNQNLFIVITQTGGPAAGASRVDLLLSTQCSPLPVRFGRFDANRVNANVVGLSWTTETEINNNGFAVERNDGDQWRQIQFVRSQALNGNSSVPIHYDLSDLNSNRAITQYRIRQVDLDGKIKYSEIRAVRGDGQDQTLLIYPNPSADGRITIVFEEDRNTRDVTLHDMNGRILMQWPGIHAGTLRAENLIPGVYNLRVIVRETGIQSFKKIIISR